MSVEGARLGGDAAAKDAAHVATWQSLWARSYVQFSLNNRSTTTGSGTEAASSSTAEAFSSSASSSSSSSSSSGEEWLLAENLKAVNDAYVYQRYLDLCDGRNTWGVIKFNGQAFTTSLNGTQGGKKKGLVSADYRDWGPSNWIQNTRQPYYAAIAAGDSDVLRGILKYYNRSLPVARARVSATIGIGGAFWPETSTLFGTYEAAFLGYGCNGSGTFIRIPSSHSR